MVQELARRRELGAASLLQIGNPAEANRQASLELSSGAAPAAAAALADVLLAPAPDHVMEGAIARLAVKCGRRKEDDRSADFSLAVFIEDLREYPADLVVAALRYWPTCSKWWPDWADLHGVLEELMVERRGVVEAARKAAGLPPLGLALYAGGEVGVLVREAFKKMQGGR